MEMGAKVEVRGRSGTGGTFAHGPVPWADAGVADEEHVHVWSTHRPGIVTQTFCSGITAARVEIADQRRKIAGEWMLAVCSTNDSIQDSRRLLPFPAVVAEIVFEPVGVLWSSYSPLFHLSCNHKESENTATN